jgi:hypothetical protein
MMRRRYRGSRGARPVAIAALALIRPRPQPGTRGGGAGQGEPRYRHDRDHPPWHEQHAGPVYRPIQAEQLAPALFSR